MGRTARATDSCQRWVSACVLARTNAYGVHVQISMRAPAVVPPGRDAQYAKIQAALATSPGEVATFGGREGAFYGNLFATTPVNPAASLDYSGPAIGPTAVQMLGVLCVRRPRQQHSADHQALLLQPGRPGRD